MKKKLITAAGLVTAMILLAGIWLVPRYQVPILMYHSVAPAWFEPLNNVRPENFVRQMNFIQQHGFHVITLEELVGRIRMGKGVDRKSVVLTFDDGYDNNFTHVYPQLLARQFPAAIFVEAANVGNRGRLTWAQAREMSAHGITFGSHTLTGIYIPDVKPEEALFEIKESKRLIETRLGRPVLFFSYPIGGFNPAVKMGLKEAGYAAAVATNRGKDHGGRDLYELKRIRVKDED
ncbi:MAG: polysaccharide deacetylase family protein, partial [Candidatus Omnitrophota bacterium]